MNENMLTIESNIEVFVLLLLPIPSQIPIQNCCQKLGVSQILVMLATFSILFMLGLIEVQDQPMYYVFLAVVLLCMPKFSRVLCAATRAPNFSRFEKYTSALLQADNFSKVSGTIITKQVIRKDQTHT